MIAKGQPVGAGSIDADARETGGPSAYRAQDNIALVVIPCVDAICPIFNPNDKRDRREVCRHRVLYVLVDGFCLGFVFS